VTWQWRNTVIYWPGVPFVDEGDEDDDEGDEDR
jgi:hypothetical protein